MLSGSTDVRADLRERVLPAAAELDYQPDILAQSLRRGATRPVGFIADDLSNNLIADIATGAESRAPGARLLAAGDELGAGPGARPGEPAGAPCAARGRADDVPGRGGRPRHRRGAACHATSRLCVIEGDLPPSVPALLRPLRPPRGRDGAALRHLIELGPPSHRRDRGPVRVSIGPARALGLEDVASERRRGLVLHHVETELASQAARASTRAGLDDRPPTAIATGGDGSLPGVIERPSTTWARHRRGHLARDERPGTRSPVFRPPLAAITRDGALIGATAAELLLERNRTRGPGHGPHPADGAPEHERRSVGASPRRGWARSGPRQEPQVRPPSTSSATPVRNDASSLMRNVGGRDHIGLGRVAADRVGPRRRGDDLVRRATGRAHLPLQHLLAHARAGRTDRAQDVRGDPVAASSTATDSMSPMRPNFEAQ